MSRYPVLTATRARRSLGPTAALAVSWVLAGCGFAARDQPSAEAEPAAEARWVGPAPEGRWTDAVPYPENPDEPRLRSLRQITHAGTNAEAYFSPDGQRLVFQATWPGVSQCDQIYTVNLDGSDLQRISTGDGRTTCGWIMPGEQRILFASTHENATACPTPPDRSQGYVWGLFEYDIFTRDLRTGEVQPLTRAPGYDAEATMSPDGRTIVFTSMRSGDLDLWLMDADGSNVRQLTRDEGYEGGAVFSWDGRKIVYRAFYPQNDEERQDYRRLLDQGLVRGGRLELYVIDVDGSNRRQVTTNGASNFAPAFHPNGRQILFSSNMHIPGGRGFSLYLINEDGTGLERVTSDDMAFDGFPMFSPDGGKLAFASSRGGASPGEINVFVADWVNR